MGKADELWKRAAKVDPTVWTLAAAGVVAVGISLLVNSAPTTPPRQAARPPVVTTGAVTPASPAAVTPAPAASPSGARPVWAASATGRIEPKEGELRIPALLQGRIVEVAVKANDKVKKGDLLVRIDDEDANLKVAAATSEADVRKRERDEEEAKGLALDRRQAEDALYEAEQTLFKIRMAFDAMGSAMRAGKANAEDYAKARAKIAPAEERVTQRRQDLNALLANPGVPLPTRLESAVAVARADVATAQLAVDKMHVRAPYDGSVLSVYAKVGEFAAPSLDAPLLVFGDLTGLRVKAEVEERDAPKVRVGQRVIVRSDAYPDQDFEGQVTSVGQSLGGARIATRGPRRPNDIEVLEVQASLDNLPPLLTGMRVDVFFKTDDTAAAPTSARK